MKNFDSDFVEAIKNNKSIAGALKQLGLKPSGGNYSTAKRKIKELNLDTSHHTGMGWLKNRKSNIKHPNEKQLNEILVENSNFQSHKLRIKLLKENIFEHKCYNCLLTEWLGKPIALELEHKNGVNTDNRINNLTLICPNCHAQTNTYRGKNKKHKIKYTHLSKSTILNNLLSNDEIKEALSVFTAREMSEMFGISDAYCRTLFTERGIEVSTIARQRVKHRYTRPLKFQTTKEELEKLIQEKSFLQLGKHFGVSDNAVKKRCQKLGIEIPKNRLGYWAKIYAKQGK